MFPKVSSLRVLCISKIRQMLFESIDIPGDINTLVMKHHRYYVIGRTRGIRPEVSGLIYEHTKYSFRHCFILTRKVVKKIAGKFPAVRWTRVLRPAPSVRTDSVSLFYLKNMDLSSCFFRKYYDTDYSIICNQLIFSHCFLFGLFALCGRLFF